MTTPSCSVVVATHARPAQLQRCLRALARLDHPRERLEVIVVDDGGGASLEALIEEHHGALDLTLVTQPRAGPAAARNAGAAQARNQLLAFTDDDCEPRPDWLRRLADHHDANPEDAIGGLTVNALPANPYSTVAQMIVDTGYAQRNHPSSAVPFFATNNLAVPAQGFRLVGGFDPAFATAEDRDFCARWVAHGYRIAYEPRAVVEHTSRLGLRSFWWQCFAYGRGAFRFHRKQARAGRRVGGEPSYYLALMRRVLAERPPSRAVVMGALLLVWHVANTAGFLWQWVAMSRGEGKRGRKAATARRGSHPMT